MSVKQTSTPQISHFDWPYIVKIALEHRSGLIKAHIIAACAALAAVPIPLFLPLLVDEVLLQKPGGMIENLNQLLPSVLQNGSGYIITALLITLLLRFTALALNVWQTRQFSFLSKDIIFRIRAQLIQRLQRISMAEYETLGSGTIVTHLVTDLGTVDSFIGSAVSRFLVAVLMILGTAIVLLWIHWPLALLILLLNPVVIYFTTRLGKHVKDMKKNENAALETFQQALTETLDAIHQIRASNREKHYMGQLIEHARSVRHFSTTFAWKSDAASRSSFLIFLFGIDIFRATAMLMVLFSDLSIGQMLAVFGYLWFMMSPVQEILGIQYSFFAAKAALQRLNRLNDLQQEPDYPHLKNPFSGVDTVSVEVKNLHFSYSQQDDKSDDNVLNGITLTIKAGEKIALVGASGGGKSTLVQVLIGLYPATSGEICFDGVPITEIGLDVVREHVITVLQHPVLLNDSIRANLTMGREYPDNSIWKALDIAQLKTTIEETEQGLDTIIGRAGMRLSGGQRQRMAVARMILANPKVVILDEATSALDTETEQHLHTALSEFLRQRTTIIVAHRLSAVKQADRVYVFEDGQIGEQGSHETLIDQNGLYANLYGEH